MKNLQIVRDFILQPPGLSRSLYGETPYSDAMYNRDRSYITRWRRLALKAVDEAEAVGVTVKDLLRSGRFYVRDGHLYFSAGQYWPTEYRVAITLELRNAIQRRVK